MIKAGAPAGNQNARKEWTKEAEEKASTLRTAANEADQKAHSLYYDSSKKFEEMTPEDHRAIAAAHKEAAVKYQAAQDHAKEYGSKSTARLMSQKRMDNNSSAKAHLEFAKDAENKTKATDMKLVTYNLADLVKAQDGSEVTLNDLQSQVSTLAQSDARFNNKPAGAGDNKYASIWVSDILTDGSDFKAVISAMDGKYYEVGINVADGKVASLNPDATEVVRKTMYVASRGKGLCFNSETVEGEITAGGPGSGRKPTGKQVEAYADARDTAANKSRNAYDESAKVSDDADKKGHSFAGALHREAAEAHQEAAKAAEKTGGSSAYHKGMVAVHSAQAAGHEAGQHMPINSATEKTILREEKDLILNCRDSGIPIVLAAGKSWKFGEPTDFQWMPGGLNNIVAGTKINGEERAVDLWLDCNENTAKTVKASFAAAVKRSPRRPPFGCVEHHEEEKAFEPQDFSWKTDPEPGVYCTAKPTGLGETNVNKRLHTSFSPSFGTDADYTKAQCRECDNLLHGADACTCGGTVYFPDGVKGSESNPATVKAVSPKSVGSLTNWPAFKNILPVTAKEPGDKKPLSPMDKIYAKEEEKQKLLDEIRAKNCTPEAPVNPVMAKLYAANGVNS